MTEAEWLTCEDWRRMLAFLSGRWTSRKATLYLCAGLRCIWDLLYHHASRRAVEVAERAADGGVSDDEIQYASYSAECPTFGYDFEAEYVRREGADKYGYSEGVRRLMEMGVYKEEDLTAGKELCDRALRTRLVHAADLARSSLYPSKKGELDVYQLEYLSWIEKWPKGWLVREIVGNPFRDVTVNSAWLAWNDGTVRHIAQAIYDKRTFDQMPILADALEDAGCDNADILNHCRQPGEHVRGCWVVDLLLGKGVKTMTEAEWLACSDPDAMRRSLGNTPSDRKLRLFACACCRKFWDQLAEGTELVRAAERFADGLASREELEAAGLPGSHELEADVFGHLRSALECLLDPDAINSTGAAVALSVWIEMRQQQQIRRQHPKEYGPEVIRAAGEEAAQALRREQCPLLHDLLGNPFRPVVLDVSWQTSRVLALAQSIYDERSYADLPRLADALEEAGCDNADILNHCRQPGEHVRGCWVLDLLLGKE